MPRPSKDMVLVHGVTENGDGLRVIRQRNNRLEVGAIMPAKEGKPLTGELVHLRARAESPMLYDVEVQYAPPKPATDVEATGELASSEAMSSQSMADAGDAGRVGPARVATEPYRKGWDRIWGSASRRRMLN